MNTLSVRGFFIDNYRESESPEGPGRSATAVRGSRFSIDSFDHKYTFFVGVL